jgi:hypothetical protein
LDNCFGPGPVEPYWAKPTSVWNRPMATTNGHSMRQSPPLSPPDHVDHADHCTDPVPTVSPICPTQTRPYPLLRRGKVLFPLRAGSSLHLPIGHLCFALPCVERCHRLEPLPCPTLERPSVAVFARVGVIFGSSCATPRSHPEPRCRPTSNFPSSMTPHWCQPPPVTLWAQSRCHKLCRCATELTNPTASFIAQRISLPPSIPFQPIRITMDNPR